MSIFDLQQAAGDLAPASTTYFDPSESSDILARYSNSQADLGSAMQADNALNQLDRSQMQRADFAHRQTAWDRDTKEYNALQDYKAQRGAFLKQVGSLDPTAPDYLQKKTDLMGSLADSSPRVLDDPAFHSIMADHDRLNYQHNQLQARAAHDQALLGQHNAKRLQDTLFHAAKNGVTDDEVESFRLPDTSEIDPDTGETTTVPGGYDLDALNRHIGSRMNDVKQDVLDARKDAAQAKARIEQAKTLTADVSAFPRQVPQLLQGYSNQGVNAKDVKELHADEYKAALDYDKNPHGSEFASAGNMLKPDYIAAGGKTLNAAQRKKREALWDLANPDADAAQLTPVVAPPVVQPAAPVAVVPTPAPAPIPLPMPVTKPSGGDYVKKVNGL